MSSFQDLAIPPQRPSRARGFTLIEILTVVAILALLVTFTVVGMKAVGGNAKEKETRTRLERLRNAMAEVTGTPDGRTRLAQIIIPQAYMDHTVTDPTRPTYWDAVPAASQNSQFKTGQIIRALSATPGFRKIIEDLPAASKKNIIFNLTDNGGANKKWTIANPQPAKPFDASRYVEYTLPLDSWDNPIVFVYDGFEDPATRARRVSQSLGETGGLTDLYSDAGEVYWQFANARGRPKVSEPTADYVYDVEIMAKSRENYRRIGDAFRNDADRTSFWFSAGSDGKYQSHDDNLYSFEGN